MAEIATYPEESLVFVDESGIDSYLHRQYGWSKKGELVFGEIPGKRFARESFIAALNKSNVFAPLCFEGTCNAKLFEVWIEKLLAPQLVSGQVVILDNATFHKSQRSKELIEQAGCKVLFLPPYSPDLNPIEKFWAWFKCKIRSVSHQFKTLSEAIDWVFNNCNF